MISEGHKLKTKKPDSSQEDQVLVQKPIKKLKRSKGISLKYWDKESAQHSILKKDLSRIRGSFYHGEFI